MFKQAVPKHRQQKLLHVFVRDYTAKFETRNAQGTSELQAKFKAAMDALGKSLPIPQSSLDAKMKAVLDALSTDLEKLRVLADLKKIHQVPELYI